jgi:pyridoxal phosphate enzyme (YggS family)
VAQTSIADNIKRVQERIARAAARSGRNSGEISLVTVSKLKPAAMIREAYNQGLRAFGENYAQELKNKAAELSDLDIEWHFIGHLQRNKAKIVAPLVSWVEGVDSIELADTLSRRAPNIIPCLIEINIGQEATKSGALPDEVLQLARHILGLEKLDLRGLMIIPPYDPDPERSRPYFQRLRQLLDELNQAIKPARLSDLSMGMSHDFEVAIEEGATIIRVGTAILGERNE